MKVTKVKVVESYKNSQVDTIAHKGKLVLLKWGEHEAPFINKIYYDFKPIIISETEKIEIGDWFINHIGEIFQCEDEEDKSALEHFKCDKRKKILALPENFSPKQLQAIVDGKLKDGDEVWVECETNYQPEQETDPRQRYLEGMRIKLNQQGHIKLFSVKPYFYWSQSVEEYDYTLKIDMRNFNKEDLLALLSVLEGMGSNQVDKLRDYMY